MLATAAVTASALGTGAVMAPAAVAVPGEGDKTLSESGNAAQQTYGNFSTYGKMSPQIGLIQGSLNKPCVALPAKANVGSVAGVVPVTVQDIPIVSPQQLQQCTENSTQSKGDEAFSNFLKGVSLLSGK